MLPMGTIDMVMVGSTWSCGLLLTQNQCTHARVHMHVCRGLTELPVDGGSVYFDVRCFSRSGQLAVFEPLAFEVDTVIFGVHKQSLWPAENAVNFSKLLAFYTMSNHSLGASPLCRHHRCSAMQNKQVIAGRHDSIQADIELG